MKVTDKQFLELASAFNRIDLIGLPYVRGAVDAALADYPEPADGERKAAWRARAMAAETRIAELEIMRDTAEAAWKQANSDSTSWFNKCNEESMRRYADQRSIARIRQALEQPVLLSDAGMRDFVASIMGALNGTAEETPRVPAYPEGVHVESFREQVRRADAAEAKLSLARARRVDLLEVAAEWREHAASREVSSVERDMLRECAEELRVLADRLPE